MDIIKSKPQLRLDIAEKEFVDKAINFSRNLDILCDEIDSCEDCPIYGTCQSVLVGRPDSLVDFFQSLLDNSI